MNNNVSENPREQHPAIPRFAGKRMRLGELCKPKQWKSLKQSDMTEAGYPVYGANGVIGFYHEYNHPDETILVGCRGTCGEINVCRAKSYVTSNAMCLDDLADCIDMGYLVCFLKAYDFRKVISGTSQPQITKSSISSIQVPVYSLETQQAIRSKLEVVLNQIDVCEKVIELFDSLVKSRFVEMFGDLRENRKGWPVEQFDSFAIIDTHMTTDFDSYAEKPHIGIDSIEPITGRLSGYRTVAEDGIVSGKYPFTDAHIIYSKIRPALNKVALPNFDGVCSADAYPILPVQEKCNRVYLAHVLRSDFFLDHVLPLSGRAQMPKVNKKALLDFSMPLPPFALQQEFADFVSRVDKLRFEAQQQIEKLETLKRSLMQEYFG